MTKHDRSPEVPGRYVIARNNSRYVIEVFMVKGVLWYRYSVNATCWTLSPTEFTEWDAIDE